MRILPKGFLTLMGFLASIDNVLDNCPRDGTDICVPIKWLERLKKFRDRVEKL